MGTLMSQAFVSEILGTAMLILLGAGVVANVILPGTKGFGGGWLLINFGWGLAVFAGVFTAFKSGAHLNPAVTIGLYTADQPFYSKTGPEDIITASIAPTIGNMLWYWLAQMPPFGTHLVDDAAVELISRWIRELPIDRT